MVNANHLLGQARRLWPAWGLGFLVLTMASTLTWQTMAIEIALTYKHGKSVEPSFDRDGDKLIEMMECAAEMWEEIYPYNSDRFDIHYWWSYKKKDGIWANCKRRSLTSASANKFKIRFYRRDADGDERRWFYDDTPRDNSEFNMLQVLHSAGPYTDSSPFDGPFPNFFEVRYNGTSTDIEGGDMLTIALHEIGHALGLFGDKAVDGYYLVDPAWTSRFTKSTASTPRIRQGVEIEPCCDDKGGHIETESLMHPGLPSGIRRLPAASDILVIATVNGWDRVNLPRKEMAPRYGRSGTLSWYDAESWFGDEIPDENSQVFIRHTDIDQATIWSGRAANVYVGDLRNGALGTDDLLVLASSLRVEETLTIEASSKSAGVVTLWIPSGGRVRATKVELAGRFAQPYSGVILVSDDAELTCPGVDGQITISLDGVLSLQGDSTTQAFVTVSKGSILAASGYIDVYNALVTCPDVSIDAFSEIRGGFSIFDQLLDLVNEGSITAQNGNLTFNEQPGAMFDLDGTDENGVVNAYFGSVFVGGPLSDSFNGTMEVGGVAVDGGYNIVRFTYPWELGFGGELTFRNTQGWVGCPHDVTSVANGRIKSSALGVWDGAVTLLERAHLEFVNLDDGVAFLGDTVYSGGTYGNPTKNFGQIHQVGDATVTEKVIIELHTALFNMDGENWDGTGPGTLGNLIELEDNSFVRVFGNVSILAGDGYDGELTLGEKARLVIDPTWSLEGTLTVGDGATVDGGRLNVKGLLSGTGEIHAEVNNAAGGEIRWEDLGLTGGVICGPGVWVPADNPWCP